jgi:hypothetical protein
MSSDPKQGINVENLWFYFDSIERDCMDLGMLDRKATQVLELRGKLLRLPTAEFNAAIKTIEKLVDTKSPSAEEKKMKEVERKRASIELFEKTASAGDVKASVDAVGRVS